MKKINEELKRYNLKPHRYLRKGKTTIVDTESGRFVLKEKDKDNDIFKYLNSRSFNYYPKIISDLNERYEITEFVEDVDIPSEQKIFDLINLVALLHSKTTYYKEIDFDDYKRIYEDIKNNIIYLKSYYTDIITLIETHVYMSPSEYLLARNISHIFGSLAFCESRIEKWYGLVKDKTKQRTVVLHNNLDLSHFIKNESSYLISWNKSKMGIPIFDLYILYKRHILDFEFSEILKQYEKMYPLHQDERELFLILISLPPKLEFDKSEYNMTKKLSEILDALYKTEKFVLPYYSEKAM